MLHKKEHIRDLAISLARRGQVMSVPDLAADLNSNGFRTKSDELYQGGRGTYTLIHTTYDWLADQGMQRLADMVAQAFVKPNGDYAYE